MKKIRRVNCLWVCPALVALLILVLPFFTTDALSAAYPSRPIEFVTHSNPGGGPNVLAHLFAEVNQKEKILPQPFVVTIKPGSGQAQNFAYLFEKKGDDHMLSITSNANLIGTPLRVKVPYTWRSFTPLMNFAVDGSILVVSAKSPYKTMDDLFAAARKNPNKLTQGASSITSGEAKMGKIMQKIKGVQWKYVSFKSEIEAATNVMGGNIDFAMGNPGPLLEHVRAGNLRVLLAASTKRYKTFPDVPSIVEAGLGKPQISYRSLIGPPNMPQYAATALAAAAKKITETEQFKKYLDQSLQQEEYMDAKQLAAFFEEEEKFEREQMIEAGMLNPDGSMKK